MKSLFGWFRKSEEPKKEEEEQEGEDESESEDESDSIMPLIEELKPEKKVEMPQNLRRKRRISSNHRRKRKKVSPKKEEERAVRIVQRNINRPEDDCDSLYFYHVFNRRFAMSFCLTMWWLNTHRNKKEKPDRIFVNLVDRAKKTEKKNKILYEAVKEREEYVNKYRRKCKGLERENRKLKDEVLIVLDQMRRKNNLVNHLRSENEELKNMLNNVRHDR